MINSNSAAVALPKKVQIASLRVSVTPSTVAETVRAVSAAAESDEAILIGAHNLHSAYLHHTNDRFRRFYDSADLVLIDGWPILAALDREQKRDGAPKLRSELRIGSTDWIPQAIQSSDISRVCVIGASATSNATFIDIQRSLNPRVEFAGFPADPWDPRDLQNLTDVTRAFRPQLTLIGMGMPLQEEVALALRSAGIPGVIATVGGAIDQLSGAQAHAPRWTGKLKVEWLWRLVSNPRRLAYRYLVEPVKLWSVLRSERKATR